MKITERLTSQVAGQLKKEIHDAMGNEVFAVGRIDDEGIVTDIKIAARGDASSVPVIEPHIEKGDVVIHNHPSGTLSPSSADMLIAYRLGNSGVGFYIVDNPVENIYVVAEPIRLNRKRTPLDPESLASVLLPGGGLSRLFPAYELRESQVEMAKLICEGINGDQVCIAEAGTGVGKSLAYLLPVFQWIQQNDERFVISTGTINLQEQLMEKDIPLVKSLLKTDIKAVLVKGRGNYLCFNRLQEAHAEIGLFPEDTQELDSIREWAQTTQSGAVNDLSFMPRGELWSRVRSESDTCLGLRCSNRERCFILKARKEASSAKVLVVNHHLLFADLSVRNSGMGYESTAVLPPFQRLIFDEAHNIESSATSFFSETFSRISIMRYLNRLYFERGGRRFGLVMKLEKLTSDNKRLEKIPGAIRQIRGSIDKLEECCHIIMGENNNNFYFKGFSNEASAQTLLFDPMGELEKNLLRLCHFFEELLDFLKEKEIDDQAVYETAMQVRRLKQIAGICDRFKEIDQSANDIFWMEKTRPYKNKRYIRFSITPLNIAPVMKESLYDPFSSLSFTSATLSVDKSFYFWKKRLGLLKENVVESSFSSPFNYRDNVLLGIPADAPLPDQPQFQSYISSFIQKALELSEGRALVLFTSYYMLNQTYNQIQEEMARLNIHIFKQGDDDRGRLLNRFKENVGSVLFATDSFWEGVDSPGNTLEVLIICKLPFRVPTDPIVRARMEDIEGKGGNAFMEYSLPEAVLKLKQGFGRLMRRGDDKGIVLVLDSRIIKKFYGQAFLNSLPETGRIILPENSLFQKMEDFIVSIREHERNI